MKRSSRIFLILFGIVLAAPWGSAQSLEVVQVTSKALERKIRLPGEVLPFQQVAIAARVTGFVESVLVDRGSRVRRGDLLMVLSAPELAAQLAEAEARVQVVRSQAAEADAKTQALEITLARLREAAATPGAVAANEVSQAEKSLEAARAARLTLDSSARAAADTANVLKEMQGYLRVTAPFDGVITERNVHPGALVGAATATTNPLLRLEQTQRLRIVVAVPENAVGGVRRGERVSFAVPAYPGRVFQAEVSRVSNSMDPRTRTMPVELDFPNPQGVLAPGMYPEVQWVVHRESQALLVPPSSIVTTTERTFVIRVREGRAEWVNVARGFPAGDLVEVIGPLSSGDTILKRGTDEVRENSQVVIRQAPSK